MKKLLAILLAVLMLLGATAMAEDAAVMTVDNVSLDTMGQRIDIQDLSLSLVLENINSLPSIALLVDGDSQPLATAVAQLTSKQFNFAIDGMGYGYTADIPADQAAQLAQVGDAGMAMLVPAILPVLDEIVLPPFGGVDIPRLDMADIVAPFATGQGAFEISYEQVNELLDQILQIAKTHGSAVKNLDEAIQMLEQLKASGMGIAIKGDIADDGVTQTVNGSIYPAQNGAVSDQEVAKLTLTTSQNNTSLAVAVSESGMTLNVANATLVSDPAAARVDFNISIIGRMGVSFALYTEDGLQKAAVDIDVGSDQAALEFAYGQRAGSDVLSFAGEANGANVSLVIETAKGADGVRAGTLSFSAVQDDTNMSLTGDLTLYTGEEIDLGGFTMPSDLRPFDQIDEDAIGEAFAPVMEYISSHASMSQAA